MKVLEEFGYLEFLDNSFGLISFGTNTLASNEQIKYLYDIKVAGKQQFKEFLNKAVANNTSAISDKIGNNKFEIFSISKSKILSKLHQKLKLVKNDVGLFSCLYIDSQTQDGELDTFFDHENQTTPPSLSENGSLKLPKKKSEILSNLLHNDSL